MLPAIFQFCDFKKHINPSFQLFFCLGLSFYIFPVLFSDFFRRNGCVRMSHQPLVKIPCTVPRNGTHDAVCATPSKNIGTSSARMPLTFNFIYHFNVHILYPDFLGTILFLPPSTVLPTYPVRQGNLLPVSKPPAPAYQEPP